MSAMSSLRRQVDPDFAMRARKRNETNTPEWKKAEERKRERALAKARKSLSILDTLMLGMSIQPMERDEAA